MTLGAVEQVRGLYVVAGAHVGSLLDDSPATVGLLVEVHTVLLAFFGKEMIANLQTIGPNPKRIYIGVRTRLPWHVAMDARASADLEIRFRRGKHPGSMPVWVNVVTKEG